MYDRTDFEKAVVLVADGTIPAERLISKVVPLTEAPAAFEALEAGGDVMKILVDCTTDTDTAQGWGNPDDLTGATVFLASNAATYIHGTTLPIDGGWLGR